jgi:hypothetical protein
MTDIGNWLLGATILIPGGLLLLVWSVKVWSSPGYIRSVSFMYKYFMRWLPDNTEPTETQIRLYAAFGILMGTIGLLVGLLVILGFVTT